MMKKRIIDKSIGLLLVGVLLTVMSACDTADTSNPENSEAIDQNNIFST